MRAGLPITIARAGTERVTTAPAPTMASSPIETPGRIVAAAPMDAPFETTVLADACLGILLLGNRSFVKVALGPMNTSSAISIPSHSCTPLFTVTRSPTVTSFSIKT